MIDWMIQSAVTLYIYRMGWTYPARNPAYRSKFMKNSSCTRTLPGPVRPVGPTGQAGRSLPDRPQCLDRSDRSVRPVDANFGCQHMPPLFFGKTCLPKNILLSQNCLRVMINNTSAIICAKGDKQLSAITYSIQVDVETTCFGRHTFFMLTNLSDIASTCCSIDFFLHKRCSLRF